MDAPRLPLPTLWTSIATGAPASAHGVWSALEVRPDGGGVQAIGARSWQAAPAWQVLAAHGVATAVIGWPACAPAEAWPGITIDERFAGPAPLLVEDWPLPPGCISPQRLRPVLRTLRVYPAELDDETRAALPAPVLAATATVHAAATHIAEREHWQLLAVHYDLIARCPCDGAYRFFDAMLGRLAALAGAGADVIVVSPQGALIAAGPSFAPDALAHGVGLMDILPTVLGCFGLALQHAAGKALASARFGPLRLVAVPASAPPAPLDPGPPPSEAAAKLIAAVEHEVRVNRAAAALSAGDHAEAARLLTPAVAQRPNDRRAHFLLAQCWFFLGESRACLEAGRTLSAAEPESPWGEMLIGAALMQAGEAGAAAPHLAAAARLAGRDAAAHVRLGAIALHMKDPSLAGSHYATALEIEPTSPEAEAGLGLALLAQGDAAGAEARLRASLGRRFHAPALHHQLGVILARQHRWEEAAASLRIALAQHADLAGAAEFLRQIEAQLHR